MNIVDKIKQRQEADAKARAAVKTVPSDSDFKKIGVWTSIKAIKKLRLDKIEEDAKTLGVEPTLYYDVVPHPGCSTNGIVFWPGSKQLLPTWIWGDIQGRCAHRQEQERNFYYPKKSYKEKLGAYDGSGQSRPLI